MNITAIVVGLRFVDIIGPAEDLGNYIFLPEDFEYHKTWNTPAENEEPTQVFPVQAIKTGFNNRENQRCYSYKGQEKPALAVEPGDDRSLLESEPAIRRAAARTEKTPKTA